MLWDPKWEKTTKPESVKGVLIAARKMIENPENWGKGLERERGLGRHCAEVAIDRARYGSREAKLALVKAITGAESDAVGCNIIYWNDAPDRTHAEVLAAFDRAIAAS